MNHDLYIFGSAVRGETTPTSDLDVLVVPRSPLGSSKSGYPPSWSVYSRQLLKSYFESGKLFAWHLFLESKCIFHYEDTPFLEQLGPPSDYTSGRDDIIDLEILLKESLLQIGSNSCNLIYEIGLIYTAIRDIAMSASWKLAEKPCFSATAPFQLMVPPPIPQEVYHKLKLARHCSTRGVAFEFDPVSVAMEIPSESLLIWIDDLKSRL